MQAQKRKRYQKDSAPADDIITLIHLVRQNPALYNYKLQPNQRRRVDVLNGWAQIAAQIGNKYTVEECRRKWKNLRDTYHQYRLRKPKLGDGLSKWRYAKDLEFLSNVYQPKLKSHRNQGGYLLQDVVHETSHHDDHDDHHHHHHHHHHHSDNGMNHAVTLVTNDDAETFILTAYGDDVNDDMTDHDAEHLGLTHEDVTEIVKHEHHPLEDDDGVTAEVDYEEVCMYEEAGNAPSADCETIITGTGVVVDAPNSSPTDSKTFQYIDNDFCIDAHDQLPSPTAVSASSNSNIIATSSTKLKNVTVVTNPSPVVSVSPSTVTVFTTAPPTQQHQPQTAVIDTSNSVSLKVHSSIVMPHEQQLHQHLTSPSSPQSFASKQTREELDLFFDFLKKKMQRFTMEEITGIQVEFLNCVLRREAECAQKAQAAAAAAAAASAAASTTTTTSTNTQFSFVCKK